MEIQLSSLSSVTSSVPNLIVEFILRPKITVDELSLALGHQENRASERISSLSYFSSVISILLDGSDQSFLSCFLYTIVKSFASSLRLDRTVGMPLIFVREQLLGVHIGAEPTVFLKVKSHFLKHVSSSMF